MLKVKRTQKNTYISLNGFVSIDEINSEIFASCHPKITKFGNSRITKALFSVGKAALNVVAGISEDSVKSIAEGLSNFMSSKCSILVLDDFERCRIDLQSLFGFISNLIVECKCKVILIGNDKEVRRYLQTEEIYREKLIKAIISKNKDEYDDLIKDGDDYLLYDSIKEKCIYKTYNFIFDDEILFTELMKDYSKSTCTLMRRSKSAIKRILYKFGCYNLRTCKVALENYQAIVLWLRKKFDNDLLVKQQILLSSFIYTVSFKCGVKLGEFEKEYYDGNLKVYPVPSLRAYIYQSCWNKEKILDELLAIDNDIGLSVQKSLPKCIQKLNCSWYLKQDEDLKGEIKELESEIPNLSFYYYFKAIECFVTYNNWFVEDQINIDSIMSQMISNINSSDSEIEYNEDFLLFDKPEYLKQYFNTLNNAFKDHNKTINSHLNVSKNALNDYTIDDLKKIEENAYRYKSFLSRINIEDLMRTIERGNVQDVFSIRKFLQNVYRISNINEFFKADLESLVLFKDKLEAYKCDSVIKSKAVQLLINELKDYIDRLS